MRIAPDLHLIGGSGGAAATHALDCNVYALETSAGTLLFDAGAGLAADVLLARATALATPILACCLTHAHADHSGGAAALAEAGVPIFAGEATRRIVESGDETAMSLDVARRAGVYPSDYRFRSVPVSRSLRDGETIAFGDTVLTVVATPGHSDDHVAFLLQSPRGTALIAGDALFAGGRVVLQDIWDCSVPKTCGTVRRLAALTFDHLLAGHGAPVLGEAKAHVDRALARVNRLLSPELFA